MMLREARVNRPRWGIRQQGRPRMDSALDSSSWHALKHPKHALRGPISGKPIFLVPNPSPHSRPAQPQPLHLARRPASPTAPLRQPSGVADPGQGCPTVDPQRLHMCTTTTATLLLPRCVDIRASLPATRTLATYGPQASRTGAALRAPLGPAGMKKSRRFSFFLERVDQKQFLSKFPE